MQGSRALIVGISLVILAAFPILVLKFLPLDRAVEFGGDEGYELIKGVLVSDGWQLYNPVWNDQPPFHTLFLGRVFQLFGKTALVARLVTVTSATLLLLGFYHIVRWRSDRASSALAVCLLVSSPYFLELSASAMLEVPALGLGMAALWAWTMFGTRRTSVWLIVSGFLFAVALLTKLTVLVLLPVVVYWSISGYWEQEGKQPAKGFNLKFLAVWCIVVAVIASSGIALFCPAGTTRIWINSHFSDKTFAAAEIRGLNLVDVIGEGSNLTFGCAAGGAALWRRGRVLGPPACLLLTATLFHIYHRPFWYYYLIHLSIPAAWLGGVGSVELLKGIRNMPSGQSTVLRCSQGAALLGWSALCSAIYLEAPLRLHHEFELLRGAPTADESLFLKTIRGRHVTNQWVFTNLRSECFWAGLRIPPELAVIPLKRIWSEQINQEEVLAALNRYRPSQIVIPPRWIALFGLSDYLGQHYHRVPWAGAEEWYERDVDSR